MIRYTVNHNPTQGFIQPPFYIFCDHDDASHGYLAVPRHLIDELGIAHDISEWSFQDADTVNLEEDCDRALFLDAADRAGLDYDLTTKEYNGLAPLRFNPAYHPLASRR